MNQPIHPSVSQWISRVIDDAGITDFTLLQTLWSGYGQCCRFFSPNTNQYLVAKAVQAQPASAHPKGWNDAHSHQRKCKSYQIEQYFYQHYATCSRAFTPQLIACERHGDHALTIMSDLNVAGFSQRHSKLTIEQAKPVLEWLACFHADFMQTNGHGLWAAGTYWHLSTRQREWQTMATGLLKQHAPAISRQLDEARFTTLVHGDAKVANFCFDPAASKAAAVDFQYVGKGIGVQDVAYFIGSALNTDDQLYFTEHCLDYYFAALRRYWRSRIEVHAVEQEWRGLYAVACADFQRFLEGWSPGHHKLNSVLNSYTCRALAAVK